MSIDVLNPGTIRIWGYEAKGTTSFMHEPETLKPEPYYRGVRCSSAEFRKFWGTQKVNTKLFRSIIRKAKQATTI